MLIDKNDSRWKKIVEGSIQANFNFVAASMCVSRNQRRYRMNPSRETMQESVDDLVAFFTKYPKQTQDELKSIFG